MTEKLGTKGPSIKFLDSVRRYDVTYRYRLPGDVTWTTSTIGMTARSPEDCRARAISFVSRRWRAEVEVLTVKLEGGKGDEMPIQTGDPVKVVSEYEYEQAVSKIVEETKEGVEERLRKQGFWLPS